MENEDKEIPIAIPEGPEVIIIIQEVEEEGNNQEEEQNGVKNKGVLESSPPPPPPLPPPSFAPQLDVVDTIMGFGHTPVFITLEPERKLWILDRSTFFLEDMQKNVNAREFKKIYDVKYRYMNPLWQRIRNANQLKATRSSMQVNIPPPWDSPYILDDDGSPLWWTLYKEPQHTSVYWNNKRKFETFKPILVEHLKRKQLEVMAHAQGQRQLQDALALPSVSEGEHTSKQFEFEGNYSERVYKHSIMDFPACRTFAENDEPSVHRASAIDTHYLKEVEDARRNLFEESWTREEQDIFKSKLTKYGKNFQRISSFLQRRTIRECVDYYYLTKKKKRDLLPPPPLRMPTSEE